MKKLIIRYINNPVLQKMLIYTFSDGISRAMPFLVLPIIANYLTVEDFGRVSNFTVLAEFFTAFIAFSSSFALAADYYKVDRPTLISNLIIMMTIIFIFSFIIIVLFNENIFEMLKLSLKWQIYGLLTAYFNCINQLFNTKLRYDERVKLFGILNFVKAFISAGLSLFLVIVLDWSWKGRAFSLVLTGLLLFLISLYLLKKEKVIFKNINFKAVYSAFLFGLPLMPLSISGWLRGGFEKIFVTNSVGLAGNGLLSFATTISSIFLLFSSAFFSAYTPYLFKLLSQIEQEESKRNQILLNIVKKAKLFFFFLLIAIIIGNFGTILFINIFFNKQYQGAGIFMPLVLTVFFFSTLSTWLSSFLIFKKKTKLMGGIVILVTIIQVFLTYIFVKQFSTIGAIYSSLVGYLLQNIIFIYFVNKEYNLPWSKILIIRKENEY